MCCLIYKPANTPSISDEHLWNCFRQNDDGAGFAFIDPKRTGLKRLRVNKGFFNFSQFLHSYKLWEERVGRESPFVIHFRYATRGLCDKSNCHPFKMETGVALGHNGVFDMPTKIDEDVWPKWGMPTEHESDTAFWVRRWFHQWSVAELRNGQVADDTQRMVGYNRVVLLDFTGDHLILNPNTGQAHWQYGIWWSNTDYNSSWTSAYKPTRFGDEIGTADLPRQSTTYHNDTPPWQHRSCVTPPTQSVLPPPVEIYPAKTLDAVRCTTCGATLSVDLIGQSTHCWLCDYNFEKLNGFSLYDEVEYRQRLAYGEELTPAETVHWEFIQSKRKDLEK